MSNEGGEDLRAGQKSFSQMAAYLNGSTINVSYRNNPQRGRESPHHGLNDGGNAKNPLSASHSLEGGHAARASRDATRVSLLAFEALSRLRTNSSTIAAAIANAKSHGARSERASVTG